MPNVFCDSRMCQPCLVALGAGHLPISCYPEGSTGSWDGGWLRRPRPESILEERRDEGSRFPVLLFLFLKRLWEKSKAVGADAGRGLHVLLLPLVPAMLPQPKGLHSCDADSRYWLPATFGRGQWKLFA